MEGQKIIPLTGKMLRIRHVAIIPIERMDWMRPQTEPYAIFSFRKGNRITKKPSTLVGLILKNRKTCVFAPEAPCFLTVETVKLINRFVIQVSEHDVWYDSKNDKWRGIWAPKEGKE